MNVTDGDTIEMSHLPKHLTDGALKPAGESDARSAKNSGGGCFAPDWSKDTLQSLMDRYENEILREALDYYGGNISQTARALDIKRQSLQYRINKYGIII